jgi:hypothetical protein
MNLELRQKLDELEERLTASRRFGSMAGRPIHAQLFVRYSASVPADE